MNVCDSSVILGIGIKANEGRILRIRLKMG